MSSNIRLESLYNIKINSLEDIEKALSDGDIGPRVIKKFLTPLRNIEQIPNFSDIGDLFKTAYWKGLGFTSTQKIVRGMEDLQEELQYSFSLYTTVLTPLFIRSFQCHEVALEHFTLGRKQEAVDAMAETGQIAKRIGDAYTELDKKVLSLRERETTLALSVLQDNNQICIRHRMLKGQGIEDPKAISILKALKKVDSSLMASANCISKAQTAALDVHVLLAQAKSDAEILVKPRLGNLFKVNFLQSKHLRSSDSTFENAVAKLLDQSNQILPTPQPRSPSGMVPEMKTGTNAIKSGTSSRINELLSMARPADTIQEEYEESYINWLTVAKVHLALFSQTKEALDSIKEGQAEILEWEKDPLVRALVSLEGDH